MTRSQVPGRRGKSLLGRQVAVAKALQVSKHGDRQGDRESNMPQPRRREEGEWVERGLAGRISENV